MKYRSKPLHLAAIFLMTISYRTEGVAGIRLPGCLSGYNPSQMVRSREIFQKHTWGWDGSVKQTNILISVIRSVLFRTL